jgi:uncharacterized phiE125 gp8 family phage protein
MATLNANALIDVADLFRYMRVEAPEAGSDDETLVISLINSASDEVESIIGGPVINKTLTERIDGTSQPSLFVPKVPLFDVVSVSLDGADISSQVDFYEDGEVFRTDGGVFTSGRKNVSITYVAGHGADKNSIPADIKHAALLIVHYWYKRDSLDYSESFKEADVITASPVRYPASALHILKRYRNARVALL